jgi:hypothetical protein
VRVGGHEVDVEQQDRRRWRLEEEEGKGEGEVAEHEGAKTRRRLIESRWGRIPSAETTRWRVCNSLASHKKIEHGE